MYPIKLGYAEAKARINALIKNGHNAEALVTSVFTAEKTIRRMLSQLIISAGFTSKQSDSLVSRLHGMDALKEAWSFYEPSNKTLVEIIGNPDWTILKNAARMRNDLIHGVRVYKLAACVENATKVLTVLDSVVLSFKKKYGYDGWSARKRRTKHALHTDPKVKLS